MNPVTGEFEKLEPGSAVEQKAEAGGWPTFQEHEVIELRGGLFEVERVTRNRLILKPVDRRAHMDSLLRKAEAIKAHIAAIQATLPESDERMKP